MVASLTATYTGNADGPIRQMRASQTTRASRGLSHVLGQDVARGDAFGDAVSESPMTDKQVIVLAQWRDGPHGKGLMANTQMNGTWNHPLLEELDHSLLKSPRQQHLFIEVHQKLFFQRLYLLLNNDPPSLVTT